MTEIKITRRVALERAYEYYELEATYDPKEQKGNKVIKDMEKTVALIRKLTATEEPTPEPKKATKKKLPMPIIDRITHKEIVDSTEDIKIVDLKAGDKVNINVRFEKAGDVQAFINKADGSPGRYVKVDVADASGKMKLTLFGDQCDLIKDIKANAWLEIENAYCKDYKGSLELSIAYGTMEVVYNG